MISPAPPPPRLRMAIVVSIVAHACVLYVLAHLLRDPSRVRGADLEPPTTFAITTIARARPPTVWMTTAPARAAIATRPSTAPRAIVTAPRTASPSEPTTAPVKILPQGSQAAVIARPPASARLPGFGASRTPRSTLALTFPSPTPIPPPTPVPTPLVTAPPTPTAAPLRHTDADFSGLFSQNYPPAPTTPDVIAAIRAQFGGHVRIRISVDESGRATEIRFLQPIGDAATADAIRTKLLALDYVPADCNGLHCDGVLDIAY